MEENMRKKVLRVTSYFLVLVLSLSALYFLPAWIERIRHNGQDAMSRRMSETLFAAPSGTVAGNAGLSDPDNVGVIREKFENEVLYPVPADEEVDHIIDVTGFSFEEQRYEAKANDHYDDTVALQRALDLAASLPETDKKKIKLPKGDLDVMEGANDKDVTYGLVIRDIKNLFIEGDDTMIYLHGDLKGIYVADCENFGMQNISFDLARTPFSMGKVESCDVEGKTIVVKVKDNYPIDSEMVLREYLEYDETGKVRSGANLRYQQNDDNDFDHYTVNGQEVTIVFKNPISFAPKGTDVVLSHAMYGMDMMTVERTKTSTFESINVYSVAGMGIRGYSCEDMYFNRFNVMLKPGTDRRMTATADCMHFIDCFGDLQITNGLYENSHDDALNVHGHYMKVNEMDQEANTMLVSKINYDFPPHAGDTVEIYSDSTIELKATLKIESIVHNEQDKYEIVYSGEDDFQFAGDEILASTTRSPELVYKNNIVRNKRNRAIIFQVRDSEISNNSFANIVHGSISIMTMTSSFNESMGPRNCVIKNNKFLGNNAENGLRGDIEATAYNNALTFVDTMVFSQIDITNNFIAYTGRAAMYLNNLEDSKIEYNLFYNPAVNFIGVTDPPPQYNCAIALESTEQLSVSYNYNVMDDAISSFKGIYVNVTGTSLDETEIKGNGGALSLGEQQSKPAVTYEIASSSADIVVDGNPSEWEEIGTDVAIQAVTDVDSKDLTGDAERESHFKVNYIKALYQEDGIYFAFDINDDDMVWLSDSWYTADYVEIFMSTNTTSKNPLSTVKLDSAYSSMQYVMLPQTVGGPRLDAKRTSDDILNAKDKIVSKMLLKEDGSGYRGEGFIPFSLSENLAAAKANGQDIAISFVFSDTGASRLRAQASTVQHPVEMNKFVPIRMSKFRFATK